MSQASEPERRQPGWPFGEPWVATEKDVTLPWSGSQRNFRCAWCGHKFKLGDVVRCVYTNGGSEDTRGISGNPFACAACEAPREEMLAKLRAMRAEYEARFWWFGRHRG
jgi:hypothetical protein